MKNLILILSVTILFQSCYSYKTINNNQPFVEGKKYKIKANGGTTKATFINTTDSTSTFRTCKKEFQVATNEIMKIKKRKFSATKTILGSSGFLLAAGFVVLAVSFKPNYYSNSGKPIVGQ